MPPSASSQILLSPAELSYLHHSLSLNPPVRPDGRSSTQFRPLVAESDFLPGANGSARVCFADGTEAIVGVKAEVAKSSPASRLEEGPGTIQGLSDDAPGALHKEDNRERRARRGGVGDNSWIEMSVDIPGYRDDDSLPGFLASMLSEALLVNGKLKDSLWINRRFHWKLYIDILLVSPPLSYPLPLLSLTTYLALLSARLPRLKSEEDEDPLFDDDWDAATYLYPRIPGSSARTHRPPITLLVVVIGETVIFDPSKEELAVAEAVLAISAGEAKSNHHPHFGSLGSMTTSNMQSKAPPRLRILATRSIDPPSRRTPPGIANAMNTATGGTAPTSNQDAIMQRELTETQGVWTPPRGGVKRSIVANILKLVVEPGGVAEEVMDALNKFDNM